MGAERTGHPDHVAIFLDEGLLGIQVVHILRPIFNGRVAEGSAFLYEKLYRPGMEVRHIVTRRRAAFDEVAVCSFFYDDERVLELPGPRRIEAEITLERHPDLHALGHINKRAAGPYGIMKRRKFMIIRRDEFPEIRLDELGIFFHCGLKVHINDALLLELLLHIVIHHFGVVLGAHAGQRFLLRLGNPQAVKGIADIFRQILPAGLHVCLRPHIGIDMGHIQLRNIRAPWREIQRIINRKSLQTLLKHPLRLLLFSGNLTDDFLRETGFCLVREFHLVLDVIDAAVDILHLAFHFFLSHGHTSLRYASKPLASISSTSSGPPSFTIWPSIKTCTNSGVINFKI